VRSSVPATDPTGGLRSYPQNLLSSPPSERRGSFEVTPGSGRVSAPPGPAGGPATGERSLDGFADALAGADTHGLLIVFLLAAAFGWGALHALSPGHGKAMVAGYLVGARGTPRHAAILGLMVTATHTVSVFALGLITLAASQYILPEQLYPWLGVLSGLLVVGIGLTVMRARFRRWRAARAEAAGEAGANADHQDHSHRYEHTGHVHHHHPDGPITMRGLIGLGVSGGIVPCPSALVVLIAAISQHRVGLGMALILAFSLGLAATLTVVGLAVVFGGRLITRLRPERRIFGSRFAGALPALSASVIVLAGVLITSKAIPQLG
jgi:ABC-type nickel/cobalt efflux system permease component RcnA